MHSELDEPTPPNRYRKKTEAKRRRYAENLVIGEMSKQEAALAAGFSPSMARKPAARIETPAVLAAIESLEQALLERIPTSLLAAKFAEGLDATIVKTAQHQGEISDVEEFPDYVTRLKYLEKIALMSGRYQTKTTTGHTGKGGVPIQVKALTHEQIKQRKQQLLRELRHELGIGHPGGDGGTQAPAEGGEAAGGV